MNAPVPRPAPRRRSTNSRQLRAVLGATATATATALLAACGGGSNQADATAAATPTETVAPTTPATPATPSSPLPVPPTATPAARWTPSAGDTWQWQLKGTIDTRYAVTVYDIDLFDAPQASIDALKAQGRRVVCYFSAGSSENWRPDFARFQATDMGNPLDNWPGERWLDTRTANVREIMQSRLDLAARKGCDGVEPDNMDAYQNGAGFALTADTQLDYNRFIAREARARGLAVGLKNDVDQLAALEPDFDFAVNEQCHQYSECAGYSVFTAKGKPVFNAEYDARWVDDAAQRDALCAASRAAGLRTLVLPLELDGSFRYGCD